MTNVWRGPWSIPAMVQAGAARWGNDEAIIDGDVRLSFSDVEREMRSVAAALIAAGVEPGDRVAVWAPNSVAWIPAALAALATGAWLVPLNTRLKGPEAAYILGKTDARTVFAPTGFLGTDLVGMVRAADPSLRALGHTVELPGPGRYDGDGWAAFLATGASVDPAQVQARIDAIAPESVSDIIFTSGTTGHPKGVMLRHGTSLEGFARMNVGYGVQAGDRHMVATPFFHCFGYKAGWMLSLMQGAATVPVAVFDAATALDTIERERVTHMPGTPTVFTAILDHPSFGDRDVSSLRCAMVSAATVPAPLVRRMGIELGLDSVFTGYGLTENHALVSLIQPGDPPETVATTSGKVIDGLEVRVVDDEGNDVPRGQQGELLVRGFLQMDGYYDDPEGTAAAIVDGWLHTGDIVVLDERDYVRITDRKKDMFIMGGFNVAPAEVERALLEWDAIAQVAVIGVPDDHFGEVGCAFVIAAPGHALTSDDVIAYARQNMANFKVPRQVVLVEELPLNATGKVLKTELRKLAV